MVSWRRQGVKICMEVDFGFGLVSVFQEGANFGILLRDNFVTQTNHNSVTIPPLVFYILFS